MVSNEFSARKIQRQTFLLEISYLYRTRAIVGIVDLFIGYHIGRRSEMSSRKKTYRQFGFEGFQLIVKISHVKIFL